MRRDILRLGIACLLRPDVRASAATSSRFLRTPYLQNVQGDRASILWTLPVAGDGRVVVIGSDGHAFTVAATVRAFVPSVSQLPATFYQYQADLAGLDPSASYTYQVTFNGALLTPVASRFRTAGPGPFSFLVFGDSGEGTSQQQSLVQLMQGETDISFLMHTGDLTYPSGTFALYDSYYYGSNSSLFARLPVFPTPGNHDYLANSAAAFVASHALPASGVDPADSGRYYSFDWSNAHFTALDSNLMGSDAQDRMLAWLDNDLASTRRFWKIVFLHHPPYPTGHHLGDPTCAAVRATVNPILERHGVQLVLAGHEHGYERTGPLASDSRLDAGLGTVYLISGGGGADLHDVNAGGLTDMALETYDYLRIDVDGTALTIRSFGLDGSLIEQYVLQPKPVISRRGVVSVGDYSQSLAPGSLISVFGVNLAGTEQGASGSPWPTQLSGTRIQIGGEDVALIYASPNQVNAQIPYDVPANATLQLVTGNGSAQVDVTLLPTAPAILGMTNSGGFVSLYATGLGQCAQGVGGTAQVVAPVDVWLGNVKVHPSSATSVAGFPGLYEVNFMVPQGTAVGTYPLRIATADASSGTVPLVID